MEALIEGQTISFDIHAAGNKEPAGVRDLHMHKRMNGKKYPRVQVRFPLRGRADPLFTPPTTKDTERRQLMNEVKTVLKKDQQKRQKLVSAVIDEIERYGVDLPKPEMINAMRRGAQRIAKFFTDNSRVIEGMSDLAEDRIKLFVTRHKKQSGHPFFVKQDFLRHTITIGDDLEKLTDENS